MTPYAHNDKKLTQNYRGVVPHFVNEMSLSAQRQLAASAPESRHMRFRFKGNLSKFLVLAVLLSAVACSELPEIVKLMDNPANDFTTPSDLVVEFSSVLAAQVTTEAPARYIAPAQTSTETLQQTSYVRSRRDLLLLFSILRT